jgi:hypothetical protein
MPLVRLVEQHRRDAAELLVAEDAADEDRLGDDEDRVAADCLLSSRVR